MIFLSHTPQDLLFPITALEIYSGQKSGRENVSI